MCAKVELYNQKGVFFGTIELKKEVEMQKEIRDIRIGTKVGLSFFNYLKERADKKNEKFMAGREIYELAIKGMQSESKFPIIEVKDFRQEKRALIILNKIKKVIKEESENPSETLES